MRSSLRHLRRFFSALPATPFFHWLLRRFFFTTARLALFLRNRTLQRKLQLLDRRMRKDHAIMAQQVIRMHFVPPHQFKPVDIARAQLQIAVVVLRRFDHQHRLVHLQGYERLLEFLRLGFLQIECIHHDQFAIGKLRGQRRPQRAQQLLARERVVIRPWHRTMHRITMPPQWRTDGSNARPPRPLLLPQLLARPGNFPAALGLVRSSALSGAVVLHRFPEQIFIHRAEDLIGEIECPDFLAAQIVNINRCHIFLVWRRTRSVRPSYAFFAALFAAFNGSTVAEPANPRRSLGGFFAFVITMYPPCGPGTLPSTTSRFSSLSTPSTRRFRVVTC